MFNRFSGCCWISLSYGNGGSWNMETNVNLATRSDIGRPNSSPVTAGQPLYKYGRKLYCCQISIKLYFDILRSLMFKQFISKLQCCYVKTKPWQLNELPSYYLKEDGSILLNSRRKEKLVRNKYKCDLFVCVDYYITSLQNALSSSNFFFRICC